MGLMGVVRKGSSCVVTTLLQKDRGHPRLSFPRPRVSVAGGIRFINQEVRKSGPHIRRRIRKSAPEMFPCRMASKQNDIERCGAVEPNLLDTSRSWYIVNYKARSLGCNTSCSLVNILAVSAPVYMLILH